MSQKLLTALFVFILGVASLQALEEIELNDKDEHELFAETRTSKEYVISVPFSFKVIIEVEEVDVQSKYGEYLLIKRGPDFNAVGTGLVLTETGIPENKILVSADMVYIKLFISDNEEGKNILRKFRLKYKASGTAKISTTETPISTSTWPTPGKDDKIHYKAHLYGLRDTDYNEEENLDKLRQAISEMAIAYCKDQALPVDTKQPITYKNVLIADLIRCPYSWPNSDKCVIVNFALPVVMREEYDGYELLAKHLEIMWEQYEDILVKYGFANYKIPDLEAELVWWDALIGLVLALLILSVIVVFLLLIWRPKWLKRCLNIFGSERKHDDEEYIVGNEERDTTIPNEEEYFEFKYKVSVKK